MNSLTHYYLTIFFLILSATTASAAGLRSFNKATKSEEASTLSNDVSDEGFNLGTSIELGKDDIGEGADDEEDEDDYEELITSTDAADGDQNLRRRAQQTAQFTMGTVNNIGEALAPIVDDTLARGLKGSGPFNFGGALKREFKFGGVNMGEYCGSEDAMLGGSMELSFDQIGGWDTVKDISRWEAGTPRIKRGRQRNKGGTDWKVNYEFTAHFGDMHGLFSTKFLAETISCNGKYNLPNVTVGDIQVLLENSIFDFVLFTKGTHKLNPDGTATVEAQKTQIRSINFSFPTRKVKSAGLQAQAPWLLKTSFGGSMQRWHVEIMEKYVLPAVQKAMNAALKNKFPAVVSLAQEQL